MLNKRDFLMIQELIRAIRKSNGSEGRYRLPSIDMLVCRDMSSVAASSVWDRSRARRLARIRLLVRSS